MARPPSPAASVIRALASCEPKSVAGGFADVVGVVVSAMVVTRSLLNQHGALPIPGLARCLWQAPTCRLARLFWCTPLEWFAHWVWCASTGWLALHA